MTSTYTATDAAAYERLMGRWSRSLALQFIAFAGIEEGDRILDLGCGTGSLALALAARAEPTQIVGLDISKPYVAQARAQARDPRLSFRVGDAATLDFPNGSFERCYSLLALNFMAQPSRVVREMRRVTRPGGTIAAAVWDFAGGLTYQRLFWDTAAARDPAAATARARHYAAGLTWPGELEAAFASAGVRDIVATSLTMRMVYADFADYWAPIASAQGPVGDYVKRLDPASLAALADAVESAYLAGRPDGPRSMTATAWAVRGVVP
ncbi:MAG: class I SAM-dependent methyltransferase [Alphaproteobacteria bacterium]